MNTVPAAVKAPRFPQVNLLPPEVGMRRARGRQRSVAVIVLIAIVLGLGVGAFLLDGVRAQAQTELNLAEQRNLDLQTQAARYSQVPVIKGILDNASAARAYAGATEINYVQFYGRLGEALPPGVVIDKTALGRTTVTSNGPEAVGPLERADIGEMTFSGYSTVPISAAALADAFEQVEGFERVRIKLVLRILSEDGGELGVAAGEPIYGFEGSARITIEALSGRFAPDATATPNGESTSGTESEGNA
ncbi:MAG: hypothetical protein CVT64_06785 [Actinobacteria bacterium HGW-Actinobacteria-4]|nr:MAG: hypothetical protein CVT64_06785 [Actinobacteria bacterium HGW-Actinobacteria-4]